MLRKRIAALGLAVVGAVSLVAAPAFANTLYQSYSKATQGRWGAQWWDHNSSPHSVSMTHSTACSTSLSGTDSVTYRMHELAGIFPAKSLGDHEMKCTSGTKATWTTQKGDHEYNWQIVAINGRGSSGNATGKLKITF